MNSKNVRTISMRLAGFIVILAAVSARAQAMKETSNVPEAPPPSINSIEALNYLGGDASMPSFSDSVPGVDSRFRKAMLKHGMALRLIAQGQYTQNLLDPPVPTDEQVYVGQRAFSGAMLQPILTSDLRQLHLRNAQLYLGGVWNWVSWDPAGPKAFQLWDLYFYKAFGEDRVEMKAGYVSMNLDFIGLFVGGSTSAGAQGVYAVLPYEAGMSYFPLTSPGATLRVRGPNHTYYKAGAQRSIDPKGGPTEVARNNAGFRFIPHGDKLLLFVEAGYIRTASATVHDTWFRAGYMHNTTADTNLATGNPESGNHAAFVLMDYQLRKPDSLQHFHGLYLGGTAMTADPRFDPYDSYYELRLYQKAPFRSRPFDMASLVAYYSGHSSDLTNSLVASGKTVWRNSASVTGSYALRVHPGQYMNVGLSYVHGPAITPRVSDALNFSTSYSIFF